MPRCAPAHGFAQSLAMVNLTQLRADDLQALSPEAMAELAHRMLAQLNTQARHIEQQQALVVRREAELKFKDAKLEKVTFELALLKAWKFGARTERMNAALCLPGVTWHGALSQRDALALAAACHVGMSWRGAELDSSLELSTKLLEYGALGLPVLCNPTPMHRRLLGEDYPLFVSEEEDVLRAVASAAQPAVWRAAGEKTSGIAEAYRASRIGASLRRVMTEIFA